MNARLSELTLVDGWPVSAAGTIELIDFTGPANRPANLGTFLIKLPVATNEANTLAGSINDVEGPLQIDGQVRLKSTDRSYVVDGLIAAKPDAPAEYSRGLEYLGQPDAQGRRQFSVAGTM